MKSNITTINHEEDRFYSQGLREIIELEKRIASSSPKIYGEMLLSKRKGRKNNGER